MALLTTGTARHVAAKPGESGLQLLSSHSGTLIIFPGYAEELFSSSVPLHCFTDSFINATDSKWPERLSTVQGAGDEMVTALASSCFRLWKVWPVLGEHNNVTLGWGRAKGDPAVPRKGTCRRSRFCPGGRDSYLEPCKVRRRWRGLRKGRHKCV